VDKIGDEMTKIHLQDAMLQQTVNKGTRNKISEREMEILIGYLLTKVGQKDWNGVLNVINDLREMDAKEMK
jgi:hypothetical protein